MRVLLLFGCFAFAYSSVPLPETSTTSESTTPSFQRSDDTCKIEKNFTMEERCVYVTNNYDACEGGGYTLWTRYTQCTKNTVSRVFVYLGGILYMLMLFLFISVSADDFFSVNIAGIVAHMKISETVAGVTFLAFGNGAPDIFGSIASILSSPSPKAGLALGSLLGGGLFDMSLVLGAVFIKAGSFRVHILASYREYLFYTLALGWILYVFLSSTVVKLYEPLVHLSLYAVYIGVVIGMRIVISRIKLNKQRKMFQQNRTITVETEVSEEPSPPTVEQLSPETLEDPEIRSKSSSSIKSSVRSDKVRGNSSSSIKSSLQDDEEEDVVVIHNHVYIREEAVIITDPEPPKKKLTTQWKDVFITFAKFLNPIPEAEEWKQSNIVEKIWTVIKTPAVFLLKLSVPRFGDAWIKPLFMLQLLVAPQLILGALQYWNTHIFHGSPGLFVYALGISLIAMTIILIFTRIDSPPWIYRQLVSYLGFLVSVAWIYLSSNEIVGVITMIGVTTGLSFEFLGMTILAWSNCIGDFASDLSVVKQGFPRMGMAAATGGPLFNLLIGFGFPFTVATAKGKIVTIDFTSQLRFLVLFLFLNILVSTISLPVKRFTVTKWHAIPLFLIYGFFLLFEILCEANVIKWGSK